jgi:hypothetical protein
MIMAGTSDALHDPITARLGSIISGRREPAFVHTNCRGIYAGYLGDYQETRYKAQGTKLLRCLNRKASPKHPLLSETEVTLERQSLQAVRLPIAQQSL